MGLPCIIILGVSIPVLFILTAVVWIRIYIDLAIRAAIISLAVLIINVIIHPDPVCLSNEFVWPKPPSDCEMIQKGDFRRYVEVYEAEHGVNTYARTCYSAFYLTELGKPLIEIYGGQTAADDRLKFSHTQINVNGLDQEVIVAVSYAFGGEKTYRDYVNMYLINDTFLPAKQRYLWDNPSNEQTKEFVLGKYLLFNDRLVIDLEEAWKGTSNQDTGSRLTYEELGKKLGVDGKKIVEDCFTDKDKYCAPVLGTTNQYKVSSSQAIVVHDDFELRAYCGPWKVDKPEKLEHCHFRIYDTKMKKEYCFPEDLETSGVNILGKRTSLFPIFDKNDKFFTRVRQAKK